MKKKFVCSVLTCCVLGLALAGCGGKSSEEKQAANYYEKELGMDKEDAEELAHELYGEDKDTPVDANDNNATAEESADIIYENMLPEIANGSPFDYKVQIADMVFCLDYTMTEADVKEIVKNSKYNLESVEDFDASGNIAVIGARFKDFNDYQMGFDYIEIKEDDWQAQIYPPGKYLSNVRCANGISRQEYNYNSKESFDEAITNTRTVNSDSFFCTMYNTCENEFLSLATMEEILAFVQKNGAVEIEEKACPFRNTDSIYYPGGSVSCINTDKLGSGISLDAPMYIKKGAQSLEYFKIDPSSEIHENVEVPGMVGGVVNTYSTLYPVNYIVYHWEFNVDGTIAGGWQSWVNTYTILLAGDKN